MDDYTKLMTINDDVSAEELIAQIKQETDEFNRLADVCQKEIEKYQYKIEAFRLAYHNKTSHARELLAQYCREHANKKTKTSEQYRLPSANLKWKHQNPEYKRDDTTLLKFVKSNLPSYLKTKTVESVDWEGIKKNTVLIGDDVESQVYFKDEATGELVCIEGVVAVERPDVFEIEVD